MLFHVPDMACGGCSKRINEALEQKGYKNYSVDLAPKTVSVDDADGASVAALLEDMGFTPASGKS